MGLHADQRLKTARPKSSTIRNIPLRQILPETDDFAYSVEYTDFADFALLHAALLE